MKKRQKNKIIFLMNIKNNKIIINDYFDYK